ncbi:Semaphorin-1A, partial [Trichinella patagoniensis]
LNWQQQIFSTVSWPAWKPPCSSLVIIVEPFVEMDRDGQFRLCALFCFGIATLRGFMVSEEAAHQIVDATKLGLHFDGNYKSQDSFKVLARQDEFLLIGARNTLYNISVENFSHVQSLNWPSTKENTEECLMKGKNEDDCQNYIRMYASNLDGTFIVCGTNAYKPLCRVYYAEQENQYKVLREFHAAGVVPYDAEHNSTYVYNPETQEIFSATAADFATLDPLIYKRDMTKEEDLGLRTNRHDKKILNEPSFVASFKIEDYVYFWFREATYEQRGCGKAVYARVGRVCSHDHGHARRKDTWTSFVKAPLNCSAPGEFPHYFDELVATSESIPGSNSLSDNRLLYAVFNSPSSIIPSSAICAFSMHDVKQVFEKSEFKVQHNIGMRHLPRYPSAVLASATVKPGFCVNDSRLLSDDIVNFVNNNPLLNDAIPNAFESPLFVHLGYSGSFTQIAVDAKVRGLDGQEYDVVFVGTDNGKVLKMLNTAGDSRSVKSNLIEVINVFADGSVVTGLFIYHPKNGNRSASSGKLIVLSSKEIRLLPLFHCSEARDCWSCLKLQDPYCAWDTQAERCVGQSSWKKSKLNLLQNVRRPMPNVRACPSGSSKVAKTESLDGILQKDFVPANLEPSGGDGCACNDLESSPFRSSRHDPEIVKETYRSDAFAVAIPLTFLISSILGFLFGYKCRMSRLMKKKGLPTKDQLTGNVYYQNNPAVISTVKTAVNCSKAAPAVTQIGLCDTLPKLSTSSQQHSGVPLKSMSGYNTLPKSHLVKKVYV